MLNKNDKAPDFLLKDKGGKKYSLSSFKSKFLVIYFYPKDNTPGCTIEAKGFEFLIPEFLESDATVIGVSGGNENTKQKFCEKQGLNKLLLLSDPDFEVSKKYGVYGPKKFMGRTYEGISRTTYVLDESRNIIRVYGKVKVKEHPKEVLSQLQFSED